MLFGRCYEENFEKKLDSFTYTAYDEVIVQKSHPMSSWTHGKIDVDFEWWMDMADIDPIWKVLSVAFWKDLDNESARGTESV